MEVVVKVAAEMVVAEMVVVVDLVAEMAAVKVVVEVMAVEVVGRTLIRALRPATL